MSTCTSYILTLHCIDKPGIVAAVSGCLSGAGCNIEESAQFNDHLSGHFFMRVRFVMSSGSNPKRFEADFRDIARSYGMHWTLCEADKKLKTMVLVSKPDHCLNDLLYRARTSNLPIEILGVISNHTSSQDMVEKEGIPFHHLAISPETKPQQEALIKSVIDESGAELSILARYMQILSQDMSNYLSGRCINIHHSFLPGFKGAKPYHQAYERGVKIIGATAHFVTSDLDEGPIITQGTAPVNHADTPEKLVRIGQDNETRVLADAVRLFAERRIFVHENRTIIL